MKVLVTGGAGFIGSHIVDRLLLSGHDVTIWDDGASPCESLLKVVERWDWSVQEGPISASYTPDVIVHAAARADIASNWTDTRVRDDLWENNVEATRCLLETYQRTRVVFLSTCAVYDVSRLEYVIADEGNPVAATSPYAASKIAGEALVQSAAHRHGLGYHILRLGCVVGLRYHHGHIADYAKSWKNTGGISPKSSGHGKRSHVHVADVVTAVEAALLQQVGSGVYNVTAGVWSCRNTAAVMGVSPIWPSVYEAWPGDQQVVARADKLRSAGWRPTHSLTDGVVDALRSNGWGGPRGEST